MGVDESLATVQRLLTLMPGVSIAWVQKTPSFIRLGLEVRSAHSLARLAHVAGAANVLLVVEVDWHWTGPVDDLACVRYDLRVPRDDERVEPPTSLQWVGFFVARHLVDSGHIERDEAEQLVRAWNCALE